MNNDKNILQILDQSACLRKSQLLGYLNHSLYPEELRVVELHLNSCALCSDALEGMETIQNADQFISSIILPALPAIVIPEKPVEKKEVPAAKAAEPTALNHPKGRHAKATVPASVVTFENDNNNRQKRSNWLRPLGIAAGLLIVGATIWYFQFGKHKAEANIALNEARDSVTQAQASNAKRGGATLVNSDSINKLAAQKKKDSVYLAQRKAEKLLAQKDSMRLLAAKKADTINSNQGREPVVAALKESPRAAMSSSSDAVNAKEQEVAAEQPALAKKKEDSKVPASDFELGMQQYRDNNFASALLYFKTAESDEKNAKHWEAVYYSGMCNKSLNKKRKAVKYFERIVAAKAPQAKAAQKQLDNLKGQ